MRRPIRHLLGILVGAAPLLGATGCGVGGVAPAAEQIEPGPAERRAVGRTGDLDAAVSWALVEADVGMARFASEVDGPRRTYALLGMTDAPGWIDVVAIDGAAIDLDDRRTRRSFEIRVVLGRFGDLPGAERLARLIAARLETLDERALDRERSG